MAYQLSQEMRLTMDLTDKVTKVRGILGADSSNFVTDDRISLMLKMTKGDVKETTRMTLGYILQSLDLRLQHGQGNSDELTAKITYYQDILESQMFALD